MSSLSESAPTSSRPQTPSSGLDDEECRRDIEQAMMSSPTQSDDGQDIEGTTVPGLDEHNGNWTGAGEPSSLVYRNDYAAARRLISQAKANPYQRQEAEAFCKAPPLAREIKLFLALCVVENKLDHIIINTPKFTVSPALNDNINSYALAVLLSAKLSSYKGNIPRDHVMTIIMRMKLHVPDNIEQDQYATNVIKEAISTALTQRRSTIKKAIHASIENGKKMTIYELAMKVVSGTRCTITVGLCAHLALLRKVFEKESKTKYWDEVDKFLHAIRQMAAGDARKVTKTLHKYLEDDREKYGASDNSTVMDDVEGWQQSVDEIIEQNIPPAPGASA
ncbi:hypothetical protein AX14_001458 [Amanita brunnescens Koide BX004]|nr:hypothetical protein AX14_001458 [Amanita brunnescens Koide BX004]